MNTRRLLRPRSIAVFGGSAAAELVRQCDRMGYGGEIWPVHPRRDTVAGRPVYRSVEALPGVPDAAFLAVNRELTIQIVGELADRGAGGAVCYATGFREAGAEGAGLEAALRTAAGDMPLLGPNCYGLLNYVDGAMLWPDQQGGRRVDRGVAIITMSSNVAFNLTMQRRGLPIAYMLSLGNQLKFTLHDAIRVFAELDTVSAIGLHLEAIGDAPEFARAAAAARAAAKPIVALKSGRSETARRIVMSHTASLAGSDELVDALFARAGVGRVGTLEALIEALKVLHVIGPLSGLRVGAMSTSGGDLSLLADAVASTALELPTLSAATTGALGEVAHERLVAANPLDYQMFGWNDADALERTFEAFLSDRFDIALSLLDRPREDRCDASPWQGAELGFERALDKRGLRGVIMATFADTLDESFAERALAAGIAPLAGIEEGVAGLAAAAAVGRAWGRDRPAELLPLRPSPPPPGCRLLDESEAKQRLNSIGVPTPRGVVVEDAESAARAAAEIGCPVVVKALGVAHKTEAGAVHLDLSTPEAAGAAVESMTSLGQRFLVERMVTGAVAELIVGVARDDAFGPYLVIGGGGVLVELLGDSRPILLPANRAAVADALSSLQCYPLLRGYRGAAPADQDAVIDAVLAVAALVEADPGAIVELDINPLLVLPTGQGVVAADALIRLNDLADTDSATPERGARATRTPPDPTPDPQPDPANE